MTSTKTPVTVLGLGPMGQALASAFLSAGHPMTVWNRTPGKAGTLVTAGAQEAGTVDEAIRAASVIIVCLRNYDAVRATLGQVRGDGVLVNLTSGEPGEAHRMGDLITLNGFRYLDGAILTPVATIGTSAATVLYSGDPEVHETLTAIGGTAVHLGEDPSRANAYDVALLDLFATTVHGIVHAFALAAAEGIAAQAFARFATGIGGMLPEMITTFARRIEADEHPGDRSTLDSAKSAIGHIIATAARHDLDTGALTAAQAIIERAVADGHGADGLSYLATALRPRSTLTSACAHP